MSKSATEDQRRNALQQFVAKFEKEIQGVMSGLDRVLFRGSLRRLNHSKGMKWCLAENNILCKQYEDHVKAVSRGDKEQIARAFAAERGITEGDVCALSTMEMAPTFQHEKTNRVIRPRPCLTIYHYRMDPEFGWMHARIQTWFPFCIPVCINGREWLSRRMDREGLRYFRQDNGFPWVEDVPRAQQLFQEQPAVNWTERLQPFAQGLNPLPEEIFRNYPAQYYWAGFQCEWATHIMFRPGTLTRLAPLLLEDGMLSFSSPDVVKFLGRRISVSGQIPGNYEGELTTDFKSRASGDRVQYRIDGNSLKGYGRASTPVGDSTRFSEFTRTLEQPCQYQGRRVRALHLFQADDHQLLQAVNRGEFLIRGFRNRDLQLMLYGPVHPNSPLWLKEKRRRSAAISRKLRILRAHGLIQKVPKTYRYQVTSHGRLAITAVLTMDRTSITLLDKAAA